MTRWNWNWKSSPLSTNQHSTINVRRRASVALLFMLLSKLVACKMFISDTQPSNLPWLTHGPLRRFAILEAVQKVSQISHTRHFRDTINTMNQLHDSFCSERVHEVEWNGKVRDILVFIMCHMQFENGCFLLLPQSRFVSGYFSYPTIEYAIFLRDCHMKRAK